MPAPVCIEFANGLFFATTALPNFIGSILYDDRGVSALVYREIYSPPASAKSTEQAIAALESGALRADVAMDFAVDLRHLKHVDPVLGVISAYLYDSIGDVENIRRMAYYYIQHGQPIPYDIALLAQLEAERRDGLLWVQVPAVAKRKPRTKAENQHRWTYDATPKKSGVVGGLWPWMRQGWTFLDDPLDDRSSLISPGLPDLRKHLQPARFATFNVAGANILASLFGLTANGGQPALGRRARRIIITKDQTTRIKETNKKTLSKKRAAKSKGLFRGKPRSTKKPKGKKAKVRRRTRT